MGEVRIHNVYCTGGQVLEGVMMHKAVLYIVQEDKLWER